MLRPKETYLSVNALGIESKEEIAKRYRDQFQGGKGIIRVAIHKLYEYAEASKGTAGAVSYNQSSRRYEFIEGGLAKQAVDQRGECASHCGIEYLRVLDELESLRVARRLSRKPFSTVKLRSPA